MGAISPGRPSKAWQQPPCLPSWSDETRLAFILDQQHPASFLDSMVNGKGLVAASLPFAFGSGNLSWASR